MKDLTLQDQTQVSILKHLKVTEELLAIVATKLSGSESTAQIWAMPDLGLPLNVRRIHGGFFTGAVYSWESSIPFVPVDATVNSCGVSIFRLRDEISSQHHFGNRVTRAIERTETHSSYQWNFSSGNHFIIYGRITNAPQAHLNGYYAVLHSSASEFKNQHNGLYPVQGNWYYNRMQTMNHPATGRSLRYVEGRTADRFIELAQHLEQYNQIRHRYFAEAIFGENNIESEVSNHQHYGMPSRNSVAIGCQWLQEYDLFVLLTAPERPVYLCQAAASSNLITCGGHNAILYPHGLGMKAAGRLEIQYRPDSILLNEQSYGLNGSLKHDDRISIRTFGEQECAHGALPEIVGHVLKICPATYVTKIEQVYSYCRRT